jgi:hypothetical protein
MGIRDRPISPRSPWQNGYSERLIGSIRRDCLDHVIVFGERHLRHLLNRATQAMTATLPQIEMARVKPVDRMPPNLRLSDDLIDLTKDFSLSSAQAIGGAWGTPLLTPFDERYGQW